MPKVIVGMSGGVDSSVAAALLLEQGFEVEGMFMKNWSPSTLQSLTDCPWEQDQADAEKVCLELGIPFRSINFEQEYKEKVVDYFLREYAAGRTPNPDIMCNKEIKFSVFLDKAREMGADGMATGHYARVRDGVLYRGLDARKDQSYFLYALNKSQLETAYFPVGELEKSTVREKAAALNLATASKKDSQGICFIGHLDLKKFLLEQIGAKPGRTYLLPPYVAGEAFSERVRKALVVGEHRGAMFYTIGERAGEAIDNGVLRSYTNDPDTKPVYVVATEAASNRLYVSLDRYDQDLMSTFIELEGWQTTGGDTDPSIVSTIDMKAKNGLIGVQGRYQQQPVAVKKITAGAGVVRVETDPLWAVAPGQSLVFYEGDRVWGGGIVCTTEHTIQSGLSPA
ncbi:MAG: tRNA 2-thiouridine(34) synthase MnmA [Candidatus Paceibacterota bacterium]